MSRLVHITLTDAEYDWLTCESERSSVSVAELIRRGIDQTYPIYRRPVLPTHEVSLKLWRRRAAGRRAGVDLSGS